MLPGMPASDRFLPLLARALFALPTRAIGTLAGAPPPHAAGLEPDAWLVARLAARDAVPVGGDSAGGNLAAVTALALRGEPTAPAFQLLIYPGLDMTTKHPSRLRFGEGFVLTEESMTWYEDQYAPDRSWRADPRVSPLL